MKEIKEEKVGKFIEHIIRLYQLPLAEDIRFRKWKFTFSRKVYIAERAWTGKRSALILAYRPRKKTYHIFFSWRSPEKLLEENRLSLISTEVVYRMRADWITYAVFSAALSHFEPRYLSVSFFGPGGVVDIWSNSRRYPIMKDGRFTLKRGLDVKTLHEIIRLTQARLMYEHL